MEAPAGAARLASLLVESESRAISVARLLHDEAGPSLTAAGFQLSALRLPETEAADLRAALDQAMETIRAAARALHTDPVERSGLRLALERLAETFHGGATVSLTLDLPKPLPGASARCLFRIAELALDNANRHSGASVLRISVVAAQSGTLSMEIADNGRGFDPDRIEITASGTGIPLMRAFAEAIPARFSLQSSPGRGTIVILEID